MVDVVLFDDQLTARRLEGLLALVQRDDEADRGHDVVDGEHLAVERQLEAELLVDLVTADLGQVVALGVEVVVLQQGLRRLAGRRLARAQLAVDVQQRLVLGGGVVLLQGQPHRLVVAELLQDLRVAPAESLEQHRDVLLALAVQAYADHVALVDLELQPRAAGRDHLAGEDVLVRGLVGGLLEVDPRRADQLGDHDPLRAVDHEGALVGHQREVAHEDRLALDLTGLVVHELGGDEQRGGVGDVAVLALVDRVLRRLEPVVAEGQRHGAAEVLDRGDLLEDLLQAGLGVDIGATGIESGGDPGAPRLVADEPVERIDLQIEQIRNFHGFGDLREGDPAGGGNDVVFRGSARGGQDVDPSEGSADGLCSYLSEHAERPESS